jgi:DNA polymerase III gamma/tau subunit
VDREDPVTGMKRSNFEILRPQRLEDLAGNARAKRLVRNLLAQGPKPGFIVSGDYGNGKSTMARILARSVVCESPVAGDPCGRCDACTYTPRNTALWGMSPLTKNRVNLDSLPTA